MNSKLKVWLLSLIFCIAVINIKPNLCFGMSSTNPDPPQNDYLLVLEKATVRNFLIDLLSLYWEISGLPKETLPPMFKILTEYREEPEFALQVVQHDYPDLTKKDSAFYSNYQRARLSKFKTFSKALLPFIKPGVIADVGGEDTNLVDELLAMNPSIELAYVTDINLIKKMPKNKKVVFIFQPQADVTPLPKRSVDTIILSTVLHHIDPPIRLKLLIHLTETLREGGRIIIVEDSFPEILQKDTLVSKTELDKRFLTFNLQDKLRILAFLDWWGNRLMKNSRDIPLPVSFKSMEKWEDLFKELGLEFVDKLYLGLPAMHSHVMAPKAILVFEKPAHSKLKHNFLAEESPGITIKRDDSNRELSAFIPKKGVNINLSIGGSKIQTSVIGPNGTPLIFLEEFSWRKALAEEPGASLFNSQQKRAWLLSKVKAQVMVALARMYEDGLGIGKGQIEGIGVSWAGPVKKGGFAIGPNIEGFKFKDFTSAEIERGGIDLTGLLKQTMEDIPALNNVSFELLNDGDAAAIGYFRHAELKDGILLIIGTGIGSGIIKNGTVLYNAFDHNERLGEIGHHIVFHPEFNRYFYYGKVTKGKIQEQMTPFSLSERLAGPGLVKRYLARLNRDLSHDTEKIHSYLNSCSNLEGISFSDFELVVCDLNQDLGPLLETKILSFITLKALQGDKFADSFIRETGFEIGIGIGTFIKEFEHELFINQIVLTGGVGKSFGLGLRTKVEEDVFSAQVLSGIKWSLKNHWHELNEIYFNKLSFILNEDEFSEEEFVHSLF